MNTILTQEYYLSPDSGLAGYWRLDDGAGQTAEDLSFYSNNATLGTSSNPDASDPIWVEANILILDVDNNKKQFLTERFSLSQNYPNPFNPSTRINYTVPYNSFVKIKVYDILGNEIATLVNEEKSAGSYEVEFNALNLSSGVYFFQLNAGDFVATKKLILMK
jgi:hypothetical protein